MTDFRTKIGVSLGIRNNNPMNLRNTAIKWKGKVSQKSPFEVFDTIENGIRAGARDITTDIKNGKNTIIKVISEFAPKSENNTENYIAFIEKNIGVKRDAILDPNNMTLIARICKHIIQMENGNDAKLISDKMIVEGVENAFDKPTKKKSSVPIKTIVEISIPLIILMIILTILF